MKTSRLIEAADNMVFGSGGALLQKLNRDTFKCQKSQRRVFLSWEYNLPKFNSSPMKSYRNPIGKAGLPTTIFQG